MKGRMGGCLNFLQLDLLSPVLEASCIEKKFQCL